MGLVYSFILFQVFAFVFHVVSRFLKPEQELGASGKPQISWEKYDRLPSREKYEFDPPPYSREVEREMNKG